MSENTLTVEVRTSAGKGVARKLRATGRIPAVLYGRTQEAVSLSLDGHLLEQRIQKSEAGLNTLFDLDGDAAVAKKVVLVKDLQRDPVRGHVLHADLYEVDLTQKVEVEVPLHLVGTPRGVRLEDGILDHALRSLSVLCLPRAIPDEIEVDVSELGLGESVHVSDLTLPEGVELRDDPELSIASVVAAAREEVAEEPEEAEEVAAAATAPEEGEEKPAEAEGEGPGD